MIVNDNEMVKVTGGESLGATFLNYLSTAVKTIYDVGRGFGGAIRRIASGNVCSF